MSSYYFLTIRYYHYQKKLLWRRSLAAIGNWLNCGIQITTPSSKQRHKRCSFRYRMHMKYFSTDIRQKEGNDLLRKRSHIVLKDTELIYTYLRTTDKLNLK